MTATPQVPERIGPYRVLRPIARGGMAEVYEVEQVESGEHYALKLLMEVGTARKRFDREYEAMTRLNHSNIVRVYEYGFVGESPWMTMELLDGLPVQAYIKGLGKPGHPARTQEVVRIAHDIARALDHIHRRGLVHRDLKSDNVLVLPDGRVKLLDFGAVRVGDALEEITRKGEFLGTFAYASPEQFKGKDIDGRSDLYSLGVLLYRMATGRRPFWSEDHHELARQHVSEYPPLPREVVPGLPEPLERVILHLLEKKRIRRPQSGAEVADALEALATEDLRLPGTLDVAPSSGRLVGRETEVRRLREFLDAADPGSLALISGMAGSGRHALMEMVKQEAAKRGHEVWDCWGRPGQGVLPLVEVVHGIGERMTLSIPRVDQARQQILEVMERGLRTHAEARQAFYLSCAVVLKSRIVAQKGTGLVIFLWNLHEMGIETLRMLGTLRSELQKSNTVVMFIADADHAEGKLEEQGVDQLGSYERIDLPPLGLRQVAVLVGTLLHRRPPPTALARRIHTASGGLPDFVDEVVGHLVDQGILKVKGDDGNRIQWAQREDLDIPVSPAASRSIDRELERVPAEGRRLLEALSMVGGEVTAEVLAWALERAVEELTPMLDMLEKRGFILIERRGGSLITRWRHELLGRRILEQIHASRRDVLRRRLVEILHEAPTSAAQVWLMLEDHQVDAAVRKAIEWADRHLEASRPVTALEVLEPVVDRLDEAYDTSDEDRARLYLHYATALLAVRPTDPRISGVLGKAQGLVKSASQFARLAITRAEEQRSIGQYSEYRRDLAEAWVLVDKVESPRLASFIAHETGLSHRLAARIEEAGLWYRRSWDLARASGDDMTMARAQVGLAIHQLADGGLVEAERLAESSVHYFEEVGDPLGIAMGLPAWVDALRYQGRFSDAFDMLHRQLPRMQRGESPSHYVQLLLATAWCEADLCRLGRAQEQVEELVATLRRGEHLHLQLSAELVAGRVLLASGQYTHADLVLADVCRRAEDADLFSVAEHARGLWAETRAAMGDHPAARSRFAAAMARMQQAGDTFTLAAICVARVRAFAEQEDPDALYAGLAPWIREQRANAIRIEFLIARARYRHAHGLDASSAWREAGDCLERMAAQLDDIDRAVLRVHPWSRAIAHGLAGLAPAEPTASGAR